MANCSGWAGRIFGHKYGARYSETSRKARPYLPGDFVRVTGSAAEAMAKTPRDFAKRTYHGDVCERCGHVINEAPSDV